MEQELDVYLFHRGEHREVYNYMGAHLTKNSVIFRVWAPHAKSVAVVGDFNNWTGYDHMMKKINNEGIWELEIPNLKKLEKYKYRVESTDGRVEMKADPYAFYSEMRPNTASIVYDIPKFKWADKRWLNKRTTGLNKPINIYEVHLGSWKRGIHGEWLNYKDSAVMLAEYLKEMNYTHIEIMPINEYPLDASWGYQATGYYSVTSRYGTPEDFMFLVNLMHKNNIGVILDWVPGHFCKDAHGLYRFDGTPTYEYLDSRIGENKEWGTCNFDVTRNEVKSFLISNLTYWFKEFHIDGVRMDAVANMLYLSYGKDGEDDLRNKYGGKENLGAVDFFKELNSVVHDDFPDVLVVAEDSTAWPNVTKHPIDGGLGFDSKWNMGWMNDTLKYFSIDPIFRYQHHGKLTFSFMYAFSENYVLPLSHDEVVHGKKSIIEKMPGYYEDKLAHTRSLYSYQMAHPGKKLNFMGNEFAHGLEWRFYESLEWHLLDQNNGNKEVQAYVKALNTLYLEDKSLWEDSWDTFEWIEHENYTENMLAFLRKTKDFKEHLVVVFNFSGEDKKKYKIGVPENKVYNIILNSDDKKFGGNGTVKKKKYKPIDKSWNYREQHIELDIPKNTVIFFKTEKVEKKKGGAKGKGTGKEETIETTVTKSSTKKENKKLAK